MQFSCHFKLSWSFESLFDFRSYRCLWPYFWLFILNTLVSSGKEGISVYSCDCCHEALKRAQEVVDAADLVKAKQRFHPFLCDFSISGFPKWLACDPCREGILQKKELLIPGSYISPCLAQYFVLCTNYHLVLDQFCQLLQMLKTQEEKAYPILLLWMNVIAALVGWTLLPWYVAGFPKLSSNFWCNVWRFWCSVLYLI